MYDKMHVYVYEENESNSHMREGALALIRFNNNWKGTAHLYEHCCVYTSVLQFFRALSFTMTRKESYLQSCSKAYTCTCNDLE